MQCANYFACWTLVYECHIEHIPLVDQSFCWFRRVFSWIFKFSDGIIAFVIWLSKTSSFFKRGSRGGTGGPDPLWDLSEVGSFVEAWWVGEGVQRLFSLYYYQYFLARFARQFYTNILHNTYFQVQYSVILSLYYPYPYEKNPTYHLLLSWKGIFVFFLSKITRFYTI